MQENNFNRDNGDSTFVSTHTYIHQNLTEVTDRDLNHPADKRKEPDLTPHFSLRRFNTCRLKVRTLALWHRAQLLRLPSRVCRDGWTDCREREAKSEQMGGRRGR